MIVCEGEIKEVRVSACPTVCRWMRAREEGGRVERKEKHEDVTPGQPPRGSRDS